MEADVPRSADAANEVFDGGVEAFGELREDPDAWIAFAAFDPADVGERESGGDGDLLLGQPALGADRSDIGGEVRNGSLGRHGLDLSE